MEDVIMDNYMSDFKQNMVIKNFSLSTQKSYSYRLKYYLEYCKKQKAQINSESFKTYIYKLKAIDKLSTATLKQSIGAVKFFLNTHLTCHTN
jgi:site-specific recombinase XerD